MGDVTFRGMVLGERGQLQQCDTFDAQVYVLTKGEGGRSKPITHKYIQQTFGGVWTIDGCVLLHDEKASPLIMPGDTSNVKLWLRKPMVLQKGQRFSMRENKFTALTGIVTATLPPHEEQLGGFNYMPATIAGRLTEAQQARILKKR